MALPQVTERVSHGAQAWFVGDKKTFANYARRKHNDGGVGIVFAAADGVQSSLVASDPERFYVPPYVGHRGWVGVRVDIEPVQWERVEDLVEDAYRCVAPQKLIALLDDAE